MPGKRKDQRILVEEALAKMVLASVNQAAHAELEALAAQMSDLTARLNHALKTCDLTTYEETACKVAGRRGDAHFEVDPDGKVVLVVAYGGSDTPPLTRDTFKAKAWNKKSAPPAPPKGRGFIKTAPSVTPATPVQGVELFDDDLSNLFDRNPPEPLTQSSVGVVSVVKNEELAAPASSPPRRTLRRLSGDIPVLNQQTKSLGDILVDGEGVDLNDLLKNKSDLE